MTITAWQRDARLTTAQEKLHMVRDTMGSVREKMDTLRQVISDGDEKLVTLRANQIVNGSPQNERQDTLSITLAESREELRNLELEEKALLMAEQTVLAAVREAERQAKAQAGQRLIAAYQAEVKTLKALVDQAQTANDRLRDLDAHLKQSGLSETGGTKQLILISRGGAAWNALSPVPIHGPVIHVTDWLAHVDRLLGE
jgi:hypothetical protein